MAEDALSIRFSIESYPCGPVGLFNAETHHRKFSGGFDGERQADVAQADDSEAQAGGVEGVGMRE